MNQHQGRHKFVPRLDVLEDRFCPSSIRVLGPVMFINGDSAANTVTITDDGAGNVEATIDSTTVSRSGIKAIFVNTKDGGDSVSYTMTGDRTSAMALAVNLGRGVDDATLDITGDVGAFFGVAVLGGADSDDISLTYSGAITSNFGILLDGGASSDTVAGDIAADSGSTGRLGAVVSGGAGTDDVSLKVTGAIDDLFALLDGGAGTDIGTRTSNVRSRGVETDVVVP